LPGSIAGKELFLPECQFRGSCWFLASNIAEPAPNGDRAMAQATKSQRVELVINGKAKLVIEDEGSYQRLMELVERVDTVAAVKESMKSFERGEGRPALKALDELRRKYEIPG
jgi:hypothetical protein